MKASSLILPSLSQISISTKIKPLFWVYLIAIVEGALYLLFDEPHIGTDTWSYIEAWNTISQGHLSVFRTPVYPIFLGFLQRIFGDNNIFWPVTIIQYGVMLLSIKYFFRTTGFLMYSMNKRIFICLLYVLHPTIFQWATYIQTEAFATAGIVFLLFIMGKTWSINAKFHQYIILGLLSSLLILLRPGFICLIPILIIYSIILSIKHNQRCIIYFLPTIITLSLVLGYGLCYKKSFGIFGLSNVSTYNQHIVLTSYDLWDDEIITDPLEKEVYQNFVIQKNPWDFIPTEIESNYNSIREGNILAPPATLNTKETVKAYNSLVLNQIKNNPKSYLKTIFSRLLRSHTLEVLPIYSHKIDSTFLVLITPNFTTYWLLFITTAIYLFYYYFKLHRIPWFTIIILLIAFEIVLTSILGACAEWARLSLPAIPACLFLIGVILDSIFKIELLPIPINN